MTSRGAATPSQNTGRQLTSMSTWRARRAAQRRRAARRAPSAARCARGARASQAPRLATSSARCMAAAVSGKARPSEPVTSAD